MPATSVTISFWLPLPFLLFLPLRFFYRFQWPEETSFFASSNIRIFLASALSYHLEDFIRFTASLTSAASYSARFHLKAALIFASFNSFAIFSLRSAINLESGFRQRYTKQQNNRKIYCLSNNNFPNSIFCGNVEIIDSMGFKANFSKDSPDIKKLETILF